MIKSIISERQRLRQTTISEVSKKWANSQSINGPILTIPLSYEEKISDDEVTEYTRYLHVLPEKLNIDGQIDPTRLRRSIYEVVVYESNLSINGRFKIDKPIDKNNLKKIHYKNAFITMGISDLRGIKNQMLLDWNGTKLEVEPGSKIPEIISSGVTISLPDLTEMTEVNLDFNMNIDLQGSQNISFTPLGKSTDIEMKSEWPDPSFNGAFLPDERDVTDAGFSAKWNVLQLNRNYPQSWIGNLNVSNIRSSAFGIDLILPLNDYLKSMRAAKYAAMTIALTFLIFFVIEILNHRKIHPFQYTLVGFALLLFYILLISISEHLNFNIAYFISSVVVIGMISLYSISVFKKNKLSMLLMAILISIYGFVFTTMQLTEYALLMGSVGLAVILSLTMYFTKNINWYKLNERR
jgi:inner membrane protein